MLFSLLLTQVVTAYSPEKIDLTISQPCRADQQTSGEVVVCVNRNGESPYRLKQSVRRKPETTPPKAELQIVDGVAVAGETEQADVGGFPSNRAMIKLKIKF